MKNNRACGLDCLSIELHVVFVDLEKAYNRVPREQMWYLLRRKDVPEAYINIIRDMYASKVAQTCNVTITWNLPVAGFFRMQDGG